MTFQSRSHDLLTIGDRLRCASAVTPQLIAEVLDGACRRLPAVGQARSSAHINGLIDAHAWIDLALALIEIELPLWRIRRIAYDGGEWHCALSRQRELPDWLDQSIEGRHADLTLAILIALIEAQSTAIAVRRSSVPDVRRMEYASDAPLLTDNFA